MISVFALLFAAGVAQGLFLLVSLLAAEARNVAARYFLLVAISAALVMLYPELAERVGWLYSAGIGMLGELALAPSLYLWVRAMFERKFHLRPLLAIHAAPFLASAVVLTASYFFTDDPMSRNAVGLWVAAKAIVSIGYLLSSFAVLQKASTMAARPRLRRAARTGRWFAIATGGMLILTYSHSLLFFAGLTGLDPDLSAGVFLTALVFAIGAFLVLGRGLMDLAKPYQDTPSGLWSRVERFLDTESAFLDPDLTLERMASALRASSRQVSEAITQYEPRGFADLVNRRRIEAFKNAARADVHQTRTILELAFDSGFNSKASFYRIFRKVEGCSPGAFRQNLH